MRRVPDFFAKSNLFIYDIGFCILIYIFIPAMLLSFPFLNIASLFNK